ncbi:MAG TPA: sigma-70 family RNA polymerase sigma factor [Acidimicrobiales bacterium]|nr:sigma-70 family RNA polymerase sigma factor [Acidimicrobiales bacterium]
MSDSELAARASAGDAEAFASLYRRHVDAAWRVAQAVADDAEDAADAVSEAFARLLSTMARGRLLPTVPFRPYLLVATRNAAIDSLRRRRHNANVDVATIEQASLLAGPSEQVADRADAAFVATAFRGLPERWRSVLWLTAVEGMSAREVGQRLGLSANGAAQLAVRARTGLRQRYLQAHVATATEADCREATSQLGAYAAGGLSTSAVAKVDQHLAGCARCRARLVEVEDVESTLRKIVLPLPALLAPATFERVRTTLTATNSLRSNLLVGGSRTAQATRVMWRPMATATSGLLALGVITAAVLGGGGAVTGNFASGPANQGSVLPRTQAFPAEGLPSPDNPAPASTAPAPAILAAVPQTPGAGPSATPGGTNPGGGGNGGGTRTPRGSRTPSGAPGSTSPTPTPNPSTTPAPAKPVLQVGLSANLSALTASVGLGLGSNSCIGVSVNGSKSCATPAPKTPGLAVSVATPLGTIAL